MCLLMLCIEKVYITHHDIKIIDHREFNKMNINILIKKWMLCDALWVPRRKKGELCIKKREYKEYFSKEYKKTMLMRTLLFPTYNRKDKSH